MSFLMLIQFNEIFQITMYSSNECNSFCLILPYMQFIFIYLFLSLVQRSIRSISIQNLKIPTVVT